MTFDLSHLYKTETVDCGVFSVIVRQIPNGEYMDMQDAILGSIQLGDKAEIKARMASIQLKASDFSARKAILAIVSWTLKDSKGNAVPVSIEAWRALPRHITEEIEKAITRLNPEEDEDFRP